MASEPQPEGGSDHGKDNEGGTRIETTSAVAGEFGSGVQGTTRLPTEIMAVRDAVKRAKSYVAELFAEEGLENLGLEEIEHDDQDRTWNVTVGFSRPWNTTRNALTALTGDTVVRRTYRVVKVRDTDGEILSVRRREIGD